MRANYKKRETHCSMPINRIEIGPGGLPRQDWVGREDVLEVEEGEWNKFVGVLPETIDEIYLANVLGYPGERVKRCLGDYTFNVPVPLAANYYEMVRWAALFHRVLKPGGIVTVIDDNTPVENPNRYIVGPFTEQRRFTLIEQETLDSSPYPIPGYRLVFQKPE